MTLNELFQSIKANDINFSSKLEEYLGTEGQTINDTDPHGQTLLMHIAKSLHKNQEILTTLLAAHPNPNLQDAQGYTALHRACFLKKLSVETIDLLFQAGADINSVNAQGQTPLYVAILQGNKSAAEFLINQGATITQSFILRLEKDKDPEDPSNALTSTEVYDMLREAGALVSATDHDLANPNQGVMQHNANLSNPRAVMHEMGLQVARHAINIPRLADIVGSYLTPSSTMLNLFRRGVYSILPSSSTSPVAATTTAVVPATPSSATKIVPKK